MPRQITTRLFGLSVLLLAAAASAQETRPTSAPSAAGDWPQWRGPNTSGATSGGPPMAARWPKEGPPKLWETFLAGDNGSCWGSPSAAEGRVYVMVMAWEYKITDEAIKGLANQGLPASAIEDIRANGLNGYKEDAWLRKHKIPATQKKNIVEALGKPQSIDRIACLDADTGKIIWKKDYVLDVPWGPGGGSRGTACTPCIYNGRVYFSLSIPKILCLDAKTGEEIWSAAKVGGHYCSAVVADGVVISMGSGLIAQDADTGKQLWSGGAAAWDYTPAIWRRDGKTYMVYDTGRALCCREVSTGKTVWTCEGHCQTPAVEGEYMAAVVKGGSGGKGSLAVYRISTTPKSTPEKITELDIVDVSACPIIANGYVYYVACGRAVCIEAKTGTVKWDQPIGVSKRLAATNNSYSGQSLIWSSPIIADGKLLTALDVPPFGHTNGGGNGESVGIFDANPDHFEALGVADAKLWGCTSPAVAGAKLFVHTATGVACFDLSPGATSRPAQ